MVYISTLDHKTYNQYDINFSSKTISYEIEKLMFPSYSRHIKCIVDSYDVMLQNGKWASDSDHQNFNSQFPIISKYNNFNFSSQNNFPIIYDLNLTQTMSVPTKLLYSESNSKNNTIPSNPLYPIAVRYISSNGYYFIERPPFQLEIDLNITSISNYGKPHFTKIWIPWTLSVFNPQNPSSLSIYFSHSSLTSEDSQYVPCFLPNSHAPGNICFGPTLMSPEFQLSNISSSDIKYLYSLFFNEYLNGGWNLDLTPNILPHITNIYNLSKSDPKKYPMMDAYANPSQDKIKQKCSTLSSKTISRILSEAFLSYTSKDVFRYMFLTMSTFTLQETLDFYNELTTTSSGTHRLFSFKNILERFNKESPHSFYNTYRNSRSLISSHFIRYDSQNSTSYVNYTPIIDSSIIVIGAAQSLKKYGQSYETFRDRLFNKIFSAKNYHDILSYIKSNILSKDYSYSENLIFIYSMDDNSISHVETPLSSQDFYVEFLQNYFSQQIVTL